MKRSSTIFVVLALSFTVAFFGSVSGTSYFGLLFNAADDTRAVWDLEDLPNFYQTLKNHVSFYRSVVSLPSGSSSGTVVGFTSGLIEHRLTGSNAITGHAIRVTYPGNLQFPLTPVSDVLVWTFHAWVRFSQPTSSVSAASESPFMYMSPSTTSFQLTSRRLTYGGNTISLTPTTGFGTEWHHVAVTVDASTATIAITVYFDGVLAGSISSTTPWSGSNMFMLGIPNANITIDNVALAGTLLPPSNIAALYAQGMRGACDVDPCFSGVTCTPVSSSEFTCGACPTGTTGNGIDCEPIPSQYPEQYHCFAPPIHLGEPLYCSTHCPHRYGCMTCSMFFSTSVEQNEARVACENVFYAEKSATPTPTRTASRTPSASSSISHSQTPTATNSPIPYLVSGGDIAGSMTTSGLTQLGSVAGVDDSYGYFNMALPTFYFMGVNYGNGANGGTYWATNNFVGFGAAPYSWPDPNSRSIILGGMDRRTTTFWYSGVRTAGDYQYVEMMLYAQNVWNDGAPNVIQWQMRLFRSSLEQGFELRSYRSGASAGVWNVANGSGTYTGVFNSYPNGPSTGQSFVLTSDLLGNTWTLHTSTHMSF